MLLKCRKQDLVKGLNTVSRAVSPRATMHSLKYIMLETTVKGLAMYATDMEISIKTEIAAEVATDGQILVPAKLFSDIVRKLPDQSIEINCLSQEREQGAKDVLIKSGHADFTVVGFGTEEFPEIFKDGEPNRAITLDDEVFIDMVNKTVFAASTDMAKGIITGILTKISRNEIEMVALDGYRLAVARRTTESVALDGALSFIIAARLMREISKAIQDEEDESRMNISFFEKNAVFSKGDTEISIRLMEGDFIQYESLIPTGNSLMVIVDKKELRNGLDRASIFAMDGKNNLVKIKVENGEMEIRSKSVEGEVVEQLAVEQDGEGVTIGFNSKYINEIVGAIDDDEIALHFNTAVTPCMVRPIEGNDFEYLALPVRLPSA